MDNLVSIVNNSNYRTVIFGNKTRYMNLWIDEKLTLLIELDDLPCLHCEKSKVENTLEFKEFINKNEGLFKNIDDLSSKLVIKSNDLVGVISKCLSCVGCKKDTMRFYEKLRNINEDHHQKNGKSKDEIELQNKCLNFALDPLYVDSNGTIRLKNESITPSFIYSLFYIHGKNIENYTNTKSKANTRCQIHSLENFRNKYVDINAVWNLVNVGCLKQILSIHIDQLLKTINTYLKKHKFCCDCKEKVLLAFDILTGKASGIGDRRYLPSLYEGFKCCDEHIHVKCEKEFVALLIKDAESELNSDKREKHAKTIDTAQEEVLKCIGIYLSETFHKIVNRIKSEECAWHHLFYCAVSKLRDLFEVEFNKANERFDLNLILSEFDALDEKRKAIEKEKEKRKNEIKKSSSKKQNEKVFNKETISEPANKIVAKKEPKKIMKLKVNEVPKNSTIGVTDKCECKVESLNINNELPSSPCVNNIKLSWDEKIIANKDTVEDSNQNKAINSLKDCLCRSKSPINIISCWKEIQNLPLIDDFIDDSIRITDEEKREYFANKKLYMKKLKLHRQQLKDKFQKKFPSNAILKPKTCI